MLRLDSSGDLTPLRAAFDVASALARSGFGSADGSVLRGERSSPFVVTELPQFDAEVAAARADADGSNKAAEAEAKLLTELGMAQFKQHQLSAALAYFDAAILAAPSRAAFMWQRGLCLFYLKQVLALQDCLLAAQDCFACCSRLLTCGLASNSSRRRRSSSRWMLRGTRRTRRRRYGTACRR